MHKNKCCNSPHTARGRTTTFIIEPKFGEGEYCDIAGLCKVAYRTEEARGADADGACIEEKGWSLTPGAYVGVAPTPDDGVDFAERMTEIHRELLRLQAESNVLMDTIARNMRAMGL